MQTFTDRNFALSAELGLWLSLVESNRNYLDTEGTHAPRGLRERKRLETLCAIEDHATRLVLDKGYDNVTIEDIVDARSSTMSTPRKSPSSVTLLLTFLMKNEKNSSLPIRNM